MAIPPPPSRPLQRTALLPRLEIQGKPIRTKTACRRGSNRVTPQEERRTPSRSSGLSSCPLRSGHIRSDPRYAGQQLGAGSLQGQSMLYELDVRASAAHAADVSQL